jgi:hypothetical protein
MTNFLQWRKMTWILLLWSGAMVTWLLVAGPGAQLAGLLWLLGMVSLGFVWFASQPLFRQGRGLGNGFFVRPGRGNWRLVNRNRAF